MKIWGERVKRTTNPTLVDSDVFIKNKPETGLCPLPERHQKQSDDDTEQLKQNYYRLREQLQKLENELRRRGVRF